MFTRFLALLILVPMLINVSFAAPDFEAKVKAAMGILQAKCSELGAPKVEGTEMVGEKNVPVRMLLT